MTVSLLTTSARQSPGRLRSQRASREPSMPSASRAVIRDRIIYANGAGPALAPLGEYEITRVSDAEVGFSNASTQHAFKLSVDAILQHLCEGRMRLIGGDRLPRIAKA